MINDEEVMSVGTQHICRNVSEQQHLPQVYIMSYQWCTRVHPLQKVLGHIQNYHLLLTKANSSY
jgi:hypothetical protein